MPSCRWFAHLSARLTAFQFLSARLPTCDAWLQVLERIRTGFKISRSRSRQLLVGLEDAASDMPPLHLLHHRWGLLRTRRPQEPEQLGDFRRWFQRQAIFVASGPPPPPPPLLLTVTVTVLLASSL